MCLKTVILFILVFVLSVSAIPQMKTDTRVQQKDNDRKPTIKEDREARRIVIAFIKRYEETQDIKPLIKEFFIKDFSTRLKVCYTTDKCRGFAKDFFAFEEKGLAKRATKSDLLRLYSNGVNYFFLGYQIPKHLNLAQDESYEENIRKIIFKELTLLIKNDSKLLKLASEFFEVDLTTGAELDESSRNPSDLKTIKQFRNSLRNGEKIIDAFRKLERKLRANKQKENLNTDTALQPKNFRIYAEPSDREFFNYPTATRIIEVWVEDVSDFPSFPFIFNLIRENGKLKIIAVYPPMD